MSAVQMQNVRKDYKLGNTVVNALRGVDLTIQRGEFTAIGGASGSGKSTMLNIIGCLDRPTSGDFWVGGQHVNGLKDGSLNELRLRTIGFIFQSFNLVPVLNVYENVELPLLIMKDISANERKERVNYFMAAVGLELKAKAKPSELSGGQRQRVAVARALVTKPQIVLADEPTANLDSKTGIEVIELMLDINRKESTTFIFSTHDPKVLQKATRVLHMEDGVLHEESPL